MEKIDVTQTYTEIDQAIQQEDHERVLILSDKILKVNPNEKEAFQCKVIALINLSKNDEIISTLEKSKLEKEYLMEYAYALHEKKKYAESIQILNQNLSSRKDLESNINELLAQNYYKMGNFTESYRLYKEIIYSKNGELEEEKDLISNFLAAFVLSESKDETNLRQIMKYLNTWESFYNYSIICLKQGNLNESMETLMRMHRDFPQQGDEFNELKNLNLNLNIVQSVLEGFDYSKMTNITEEYEKAFSKNEIPELVPYFYNNSLHIRKDRDAINEVTKKLDSFLKNENLFPQEKTKITLNKIILLLRANRINDALEIFKTIPVDFNDPNYVIIHCYIVLKQEKLEKFEDLVKNDNNFKNRPEAHLILIQMLFSTLNSKNLEQFHIKVLNFVKQFFDFTVNFHFLNFFIGFYESRHLKDQMKEFVRNYKDPNLIFKTIGDNPKLAKKCLTLLGKSFSYVGFYEESVSFFQFILENVDQYDMNVKLELLNSLPHVNTDRSEEIRRGIDETMIDLSMDHINSLLSDVFVKNKRTQQGEKKKTKTNKKKNKKFPKNFDPKKPGPLPDPERWLPKLQRKKFRGLAKNKLAYQGANADSTTTATQFGKK